MVPQNRASCAAGRAPAGVLPAQARDRDDWCAQRIRKAEAQLDNAVRKHGRNSRQAEKRRQELDRVRDQCGRRDKH